MGGDARCSLAPVPIQRIETKISNLPSPKRPRKHHQTPPNTTKHHQTRCTNTRKGSHPVPYRHLLPLDVPYNMVVSSSTVMIVNPQGLNGRNVHNRIPLPSPLSRMQLGWAESTLQNVQRRLLSLVPTYLGYFIPVRM